MEKATLVYSLILNINIFGINEYVVSKIKYQNLLKIRLYCLSFIVTKFISMDAIHRYTHLKTVSANWSLVFFSAFETIQKNRASFVDVYYRTGI